MRLNSPGKKNARDRFHFTLVSTYNCNSNSGRFTTLATEHKILFRLLLSALSSIMYLVVDPRYFSLSY